MSGSQSGMRPQPLHPRGLIKLGRIESAIETLNRSGEFTATIELLPTNRRSPKSDK